MHLLRKLTRRNTGDINSTPANPTAFCTPLFHDFVFSDIPESIHKITTALNQAGFEVYLVGGCLRDKILDLKPKDFDIVTSARPEEIKKIFGRKAFIIGRRFCIVHIHIGSLVVEVITFRGSHPDGNQAVAVNGQILRDNYYGTIEEDVFRRDLTINALYYDVKRSRIIDYIGGYEDVRNHRLRIIGDPLQRFIEDPVRMLRCIRFSAKLGFILSPEIFALIKGNAQLLDGVSTSRMLHEFLKLSLNGAVAKAIEICRDTGLLKVLFPASCAILQGNDKQARQANLLLAGVLKNTDERIRNKGRVSQFYLIGVLLWPLLRSYVDGNLVNQYKIHQLGVSALRDVRCMKVPKRLSSRMLSVWILQLRMQYPHPSLVRVILENKDFRAAFDFLQLREKSGELSDTKASDWWRDVQNLDEQGIQNAILQLDKTKKKSSGLDLSSSVFQL